LLSSFFFFWCTSFHNSIDKRIEVPDAAHVVSDKLQLSHTHTHIHAACNDPRQLYYQSHGQNQEHHVGRNPPHTDRKNLDSMIYDFEIGKQLRKREWICFGLQDLLLWKEEKAIHLRWE
jgi:hypothetical protein